MQKGLGQVVEHLPSKALSSNSSTIAKKKDKISEKQNKYNVWQ
jgi:hypothetical protein